MYSFQYEESETWIVWPYDVSLSTFAADSSDMVIDQIFAQLFDEVRDQLNGLKSDLQDLYSKQETTLDELRKAFESYLSSTQVDETFAKCDTFSDSLNTVLLYTVL